MDASALLAEIDALGAGELDLLLRGQTAKRFKSGDRIQGTVVRVTADAVFVDIGGKSEAILDRGELEGALPTLGERLSAFVLSTGADGIRLARRLSGRAGLGALEDARDAGIPVEGRVESRNTGGFTVRIAGAQAFCPVSQIDRHPEADLDRYVGLVGMFMVKDVRGRDVIVSRRDVLEQEAEENAAKLWATVRAGDTFEGVVVTVKEYGVFVDVGGAQGLLHRSELGWDSEALPPARGERIMVRVVEADVEARKLSLSMKDPALSPWSRIGRDFFEGEVYPAKITRLSTFGAFAALAPGLEGLIHISNLSKSRVEQPSHVVKPGDQVRVRILAADHARNRLDLGIKQAEDGYEPEEGERRPSGPAPKAAPQSLGTMADLLSGIKLPAKAAPAAPARRRR